MFYDIILMIKSHILSNFFNFQANMNALRNFKNCDNNKCGNNLINVNLITIHFNQTVCIVIIFIDYQKMNW